MENLMITKAISVHTPKTKTSYKQDIQRLDRERFYFWDIFGAATGGAFLFVLLLLFLLMMETEVN